MKQASETRQWPRVIVFAGPNGAGKSSHASAILGALGISTFVNADLIARGLVGGEHAARSVCSRANHVAAPRRTCCRAGRLCIREYVIEQNLR